MKTDRAVSPVIATILMTALVVILASTIGFQLMGLVEEAKDTNERPIPVSDNLLSNGDFEDGAVNEWQAWDGGSYATLAGRSLITQTDPSSGSYALEMDGSPDFVKQDTTKRMDAGRIYRLCAVSKVSSTAASFYVGVQYYDSGGTIIEKAQYEIAWTSYREQCVLTDFGPDQPVESADVWVYYDSGSGTAYVDDISLVEVKYLADPDEDTDDI
jgi:flagellin-like protein